jgi:hypothetical protein
MELFWQCAIIWFSIGPWNCCDSVALFGFIWDFGTVLTVWHYLFLYGTLELFRQCNIFLFFYVTLELFQQFGIICFSIGLWNCSDSVELFVFLLDIGTFPTVWHYLFIYLTLEMFRQCGIICFSIRLWNCSTVWHYLFFYWTLELFRQCGIICFSIVLLNSSDSVSIICFSMVFWNYSHSLPITVYLLDFGTDQTVWHYWFFYWTFKLYW